MTPTSISRGRGVAVALLGALAAVAACHRRPAGLVDPSPSALAAPAPDSFRVAFQTTHGRFEVVAHRAWAPNGVDRFYFLAKHRYYDGNPIFRVVRGYVAQFGLSGDPRVNAAWKPRTIRDDIVRQSNRRGRVSFASAGPNSRTTQLFVNLANNARLDTLGRVGFAPIAEVTAGLDVVESLYSGYGDWSPRGGGGPSQTRIAAEGATYVRNAFPKLDWIERVTVEQEWRGRR